MVRFRLLRPLVSFWIAQAIFVQLLGIWQIMSTVPVYPGAWCGTGLTFTTPWQRLCEHVSRRHQKTSYVTYPDELIQPSEAWRLKLAGAMLVPSLALLAICAYPWRFTLRWKLRTLMVLLAVVALDAAAAPTVHSMWRRWHVCVRYAEYHGGMKEFWREQKHPEFARQHAEEEQLFHRAMWRPWSEVPDERSDLL